MRARSRYRRGSCLFSYFIARWRDFAALSSLAKEALVTRAGFLPDSPGNRSQKTVMQIGRRPPMDEFGEDPNLSAIRGKPSFGVAGRNAQAVIDRTIKRRSAAQELGVFAVEMTHLFDDI